MNKYFSMGISLSIACCLQAKTYDWNNSTGDGDFNTELNWSSEPVGGNNYVSIGGPESHQATLAQGKTANYAGIRIGYADGDGELIQTGGSLHASAVGHGASRLGSNKHSGIYRMSGGTAMINALQLGLGDAASTGTLILSGGDMTVSGAVAQYSLRLGDTDKRAKGIVEISDGSLQTRTDVRLSSYGTFAVSGNKASAIHIGSYKSGDGAWFQETGGVLKCRIASSGITPIFIDDVQDPLDGDGNVVFCDGALLDVGFLEKQQIGEWDVMQWEGTLVDYGLQFAPGVDTSVWSFSFVDTDASGTPDTLRVKAGKHEAPVVVPESKLKLDVMFDDSMVLQRDIDAPIWGTALPGTVVTLKIDGRSVAKTTADAQGSWLARIGKHPGDGGKPHTLTVSTSNKDVIELTDIVFGDVYICSGQSNMNRSLTGLGLGEDIVKANHPLIRLIKTARRTSSNIKSDPVVEYTWSPFTSAIAGEFTATGYFFAKQLQATTGEPVGLLYASWGGRPIRDFIAQEGLAMVPELVGVQEAIKQRSLRSYSSIYNGMVAPMAPYGVRGALWYQGEADAGRMGADLYRQHMQALVRGWRAEWNQDRFSFYYVQLPNYNSKSDWTQFREAQRRFLSEPDTGMAVTIDVGNDRDIHPTNKMDVGNRLGAWALARDLGYRVDYASPFYRDTKVRGSTMELHFDGASSGLMVATKDGRNPPLKTKGALQNFEIAGADKVFYEANAKVNGKTVQVSSSKVRNPVYVRYCFSNAPSGPNKLYNRSGFPASPFRNYTDYELTVNGGEGSAKNIDIGAEVSITAAPAPSGKVFAGWVGGGQALANPKAASTVVTMPDHDLYLVPTYRPN